MRFEARFGGLEHVRTVRGLREVQTQQCADGIDTTDAEPPQSLKHSPERNGRMEEELEAFQIDTYIHTTLFVLLKPLRCCFFVSSVFCVCLSALCLFLFLFFCEFSEPKSGTGTAGEWAWGGLVGTCIYLRSLYGNASCITHDEHYYKEMVFEPHLTAAEEKTPCSCNDVTRWDTTLLCWCSDLSTSAPLRWNQSRPSPV